MKFNRLVLALFVFSLAATPALAASLTMLQFGSFETRDEAEKKLADINSKYKDTLGALPTSIREVKLPPDNLTVYRTVAGPVADRSTAQSICSKLAATGDDCYIMQTAMVAGEAPAAVATAAPALPPVMPNMAAAPSGSVLAPATAAAPSVAPDLTSRFVSPQEPVAARDPMNQAALNSMATPLAAGTTTLAASSSLPAELPSVHPSDTFTNTDPSPGMQAALDAASTNQSVLSQDVVANTTAAQATQHQSFWDRINPWSSTPAPTPAPVMVPVTAPVEVVSSEPLPPPVVTPQAAPEQIRQVTPIALVPVDSGTAKVVVPSANAAPLAPMPTVTPPAPAATNDVFQNTHVITEAPPMQLPPPPAPLMAQNAPMGAPDRLPPPESTSGPINVTPLPPTRAVGGGPNVEVEEARRVPVSPVIHPTQPPPFVQAPVVMQPSATEGVKTIWAEIGPFNSNDDALAYWANYRQDHPDFPVVRVRVTSSYQAMLHGVNYYALRVGPIAQRAFVKALCNSLAKRDNGPELQCSAVSDLGSSTPLQPMQGLLPASRYSARH